MEEKYGFVYIWYDSKHQRFYIGSHWGNENDGYICSSNWMRDAYKRRPQDFKRKVIKRIKTNRKDTLQEEERYLQMISEQELGKKYYNLKRNTFKASWFTDEEKKLTVSEKIGRSNKISQLGKKHTEETKSKMRGPRKPYGPQSEEHKLKLSIIRKGKKHKPYKPWSEESRKLKSEAMKGNTNRLGTGKKDK